MSANCKNFVNLLSCKEATKHEDGEGISWRSSLSGNPVRFRLAPSVERIHSEANHERECSAVSERGRSSGELVFLTLPMRLASLRQS
jgi:hypothetical protein